MNPEKSYRRPKVVAGTVLGAGLLASIAGNVQSIILTDATPSVGSMISALWWPAILFGMIELAIHTPWGKTPLWLTVQWSGSVVIGGVAFYISYFHLAHVLSSYGYDTVSRYAGPVAVDVAMGVATLAMNRIGVAMATGRTEVATLATDAGHEELATVVATDDLASDWADLENDLDAELADMAAGRTSEPLAAPDMVVRPEPAAAPAEVTTTVPELAAKRIQEALDAGATKAELAALDAALADEGLAGSARTARRWRTAVTKGTARVS